MNSSKVNKLRSHTSLGIYLLNSTILCIHQSENINPDLKTAFIVVIRLTSFSTASVFLSFNFYFICSNNVLRTIYFEMYLIICCMN